ncbi:MAG TPA: hypothetical protein PKN56_13455, partial [Leptospiraceae bacterium]|nr:hypothetical protein [Leptospiraceae bacterium]HNN04567.1 hypothetical protein [Leptospiraceae bacterium]
KIKDFHKTGQMKISLFILLFSQISNCIVFYEKKEKIELRQGIVGTEEPMDITYRIIPKNDYQKGTDASVSSSAIYYHLTKNKIFPNAKIYQHSEYMTVKEKNRFRIDLIFMTEKYPKSELKKGMKGLWGLLSLLTIAAVPYVIYEEAHFTSEFYDSSQKYSGIDYSNAQTVVFQTLLIFNFSEKTSLNFPEEFLKSVSVRFQEWRSQKK